MGVIALGAAVPFQDVDLAEFFGHRDGAKRHGYGVAYQQKVVVDCNVCHDFCDALIVGIKEYFAVRVAQDLGELTEPHCIGVVIGLDDFARGTVALFDLLGDENTGHLFISLY